MTFSCKLCKYGIKSEKPDDKAPADLLKRMTEHLGKCHHDHAADVAAAFQAAQSLLSTYLVFQYVEIPESEAKLQQAYQENRDFLYNLLESKPEELASPKAGTVH